MSARRATRWPPRSRRSPASTARSPLSIPAPPALSQQPAQQRRASHWSSSRRPRPSAASCCSPRDGSWKGPSHNTYNPLLTSKPLPPMIGLAGLLNLLEVVTRLQATQQKCACASQEAGVPCLASPPDQTIWPALPPAFEDATGQSLGPAAAGQSATASASAQSPRRAAVKRHRHEPPRRQSGGHP
jgi:hypothetical protein